MNAKLTLTIEKSVIEKAKVYAHKSGRSLSDLIQSYLERLTTPYEPREEEIPEEFNELFGSVPLTNDLNVKDEIRDIMRKKYNQ